MTRTTTMETPRVGNTHWGQGVEGTRSWCTAIILICVLSNKLFVIWSTLVGIFSSICRCYSSEMASAPPLSPANKIFPWKPFPQWRKFLDLRLAYYKSTFTIHVHYQKQIDSNTQTFYFVLLSQNEGGGGYFYTLSSN